MDKTKGSPLPKRETPEPKKEAPEPKRQEPEYLRGTIDPPMKK